MTTTQLPWDVLCFDLPGVLFKTAFHKGIRGILRLAPENRPTMHGALQILERGEAWEGYCAGLMSTDEFCKAVAERFSIDLKGEEDLSRVREAVMAALSERPDYAGNFTMLNLIEGLKENGHRVIGCTNAPLPVKDLYERTGVWKPFDSSQISCDVHALTTDPRFFEAVCERFEVRPDRALFISVNEQALAVAKSVGMARFPEGEDKPEGARASEKKHLPSKTDGIGAFLYGHGYRFN